MSLPKIKKINKNMVIAVASTIGVSLVGGVIYAVNDYFNGLAHPQQQSVSSGNDGGSDLPSATQNVSVEVNNTFTNGTTSKVIASSTITTTLAKTESTIAPPVQTTTVKVNNSIPGGTPVTAADNTQPQQKRSTLLITGNRSDVGANNNNANSISGTNTSVGTGTIDAQISQQSSPYTLVAGTYIPITMQSGLNSEQRGQIVGMVSRDVYDSATGKYLLIPQGSKVVGTYDNSVAYGQKRLIVGWNRLIYPDANGTSVLLHGQPGTNLSGYSGFDGTVDNHYLEIYGSSFLIGGIMGAQAAATGNQGALTQPTTTQTMAAQLGNQMGQTGLSVVQKGLNIPPTIIINPGYRGYIGITSDLVLKPYIRGGAHEKITLSFAR